MEMRQLQRQQLPPLEDLFPEVMAPIKLIQLLTEVRTYVQYSNRNPILSYPILSLTVCLFFLEGRSVSVLSDGMLQRQLGPTL